MFKRIDHTELVTDQPDRMIRFYLEVLGFKVKARDRVGAPGRMIDLAYVELGGTVVEIITYENAELGPRPHGIHLGYNLVALEVADMNVALVYLRERGIEPVWGPLTREGRYIRVEIPDPDGNHIELRQWF